ncbi:5fb56ae9-4888-4070-ae1c-d679a21ec0fe [Sclerotinia trifoliorum]|uniref:5fb56ae9-4888-4070-ae1c-d679a21ec0fe n=1 Tax=Sclerotinia trifoliorum TaxID=28548 RepID=A0A8H2VRZ6_9HELO|nr:5fb56ae9-4888-4070-ae1c-d679a21ec0fe [Sclerotinia trifoliorum]
MISMYLIGHVGHCLVSSPPHDKILYSMGILVHGTISSNCKLSLYSGCPFLYQLEQSTSRIDEGRKEFPKIASFVMNLSQILSSHSATHSNNTMPSRERRPRLDGWGRFKVAIITFSLYALAIPILLFHILLLIGCGTDSPGMDNIYVSSLSGTGIRFSYTSICAPSSGGHTCGPSIGKSPLLLSTIYNLTSPHSTLQYAIDLQKSISFVIPAMSALLFLFALISLITARGITKHNGTNSHIHISSIKFLFWSSAAAAFAAAYTLTSTGAALAVHSKFSTEGNSGMDVEPGKVMLALQWMTWVFTIMAAVMSGSIMKTFLEGPSRRRRSNSSRRSLYARALDMVGLAPPYSRDPLPGPPNLISPI